MVMEDGAHSVSETHYLWKVKNFVLVDEVGDWVVDRGSCWRDFCSYRLDVYHGSLRLEGNATGWVCSSI